ncbi:uncharacterized protein FOMMEDRAFT_32285 [Fomitiporia mediterranea MF3/22]|uniref:uncharacterized protein n=1 Tax=Fomitiporia mediterranea (strain MF3/22) TaxID=694068 RepID=UPI0004409CB9|nr:uncharacterized protein FOMMEDRAFT_32285 [Fomitiporia mediterranea MF3/22]EJC98103.1 hypothetical protein FOMMEDRAFT_32285 [Fomitiporia mediterranea MF3/22]
MDITAKRGVKRKRESYAEPHHGLKAVKKTCKKAKAFETQRIVKKLKDAKQAGGEDITKIKTLESQLDCLKHIDLEGIAIKALRSKIKKDALLSRDEDCQGAVEAELPSSTTSKPAADVGPPERTVVESRLMSSKILSAGVTDVIASLRAVLDANRQETPTASDARHSEDGEDEEVAPMKSKTTTSERKSGVNERPSSASDEDDENEDTRQEAEEDNDQAAWTGFNDENLSGSEREDDDEDENWDSDSDSSQNYDDRSNISDDDDASSISSHSISPPRTGRTKPILPKEKLKGKAGESTFLPSLAIGFISGSNSDSDWSNDAEARKIADLPVKKNRRGQRARKAIWEKKYGKNANHLRKQRENEVNAAARGAFHNSLP